LEARIRLLGEKYVDALVAMRRLGYTYSDQRKWDIALNVQNKALDAQRAQRHPNGDDTAGADPPGNGSRAAR
jgi:hypothetical protein